MEAARIQSRAVFKVAAIAIAALLVALLLAYVVVESRTTLRWLFASIFLALALSPAVDLIERVRWRGRTLPRWLAILVVYAGFFAIGIFLLLHVIPPIISEIEQLGSKLPAYVKDFESWAVQNEQFRELNDKYDLTKILSEQAAGLPARLGDAAGTAKSVSVGLLNNLVEAVVVLTLAFFLLLDGRRMAGRLLARVPGRAGDSATRIASRIAAIVRSYVSVNLLLATLAGVFTWASLELLGVDLALPLAVLVGILDLVPLIGFTIGGLLVAIVTAFHSFPTTLIAWLVLFVVYQQVQDRVVQPIFYRNAVHVNPAVGIIAVLAGAQLAGILGALLAIPVAASIGAVADELWPGEDEAQEAGADPGVPAGGTSGAPATP